MGEETRPSGINIVGDIPWGTHFCQCYQTKEDLLDILVPYFKAGLENNEFCMWITTEPLKEQEAQEALRRAAPDFDRYLKRGQIEILPHDKWSLKDGVPNSDRVFNGWVEKLNLALSRGFAGLRVTENTAWLEKSDWKSFTDYEAAINGVIGKYRMIAICSYCLEKCDASKLIDVATNHQFCVIRREGEWKIIESGKRRQMEDELQRLGEQYQIMLRTIMDGFWIVDAQGRFLEANDAYCRLTGYSRQELLSMSIPDVEASERPEETARHIEKVVQTGADHFETHHRCKDGRIVDLEVSVNYSSSEGGRMYVFFQNVTERKQAEEALRKAHDELEIRVQERTKDLREANKALLSEITDRKRAEEAVKAERQRFTNVLETLPAYLVLLTPDYHVPFANRFFRERFGESHGKRCFEYLFGRTEPCEICETYKVLKTMTPLEWEWTGPDGHNYYVYDSPFTDTDGSTLIMEVGIDITEQKRAQEALRKAHDELEIRVQQRTKELQESQKDLNRAQAVAQIGSWRLDIRRNELLWSDETYRIFGIPRGTPMTYQTFISSVHPEDREYVDSKWTAAIRGEQYDIEHRIVVGDEVKWVREKAELELDQQGVLKGGFGTVQDITERIKAEAELAHLASFPELNPMPILELNMAGDITYLNPAARTRLPDLLTRGSRHPFLANWEALVNALRSENTHLLSRDINVGGSWYEQTLVYLPSDQRFRLYGRDITSRKQAEEALRDREVELSAIFESTPMLMLLADSDRHVLKSNNAAARFASRSMNEMLGLHSGEALRCLHSLDDPNGCGSGPSCKTCLTRLTVLDTLETGNSHYQVECRLPFIRNGSTEEHTFLLYTFLLDLAPKRALICIQDITQLKQGEEALRETRDYLENLINYANAPIIVWDPEFRVTRFNHAFERLTGLKAEDVLGKKLDMLFPQDRREASMAHIRRAVAGERWEAVEIPILRKDGEVRTVLWNSATLYDPDDETAIATIAQGQDITGRKQAEEALKRRTDELARSNAELEQFAYVASHDLQEPLRMVSSYVKLLAKRYKGKLDQDADEFIGYAHDGAVRMQRLINDLLAYSRVGTRGKKFEEVNLETALAEALDNLKVAIRENKAVVTHDPLPTVYGDNGQLAQVFQNLIDNAIKFRGEKPPRVHISASGRENECVCSVRDNGIGIAPEYFDKVFALFQRLHTRKEYPGTGIGLSICKRIVERHGGRIWVESKHGVGSTFYFSVPASMRKE